MFHDTFFAAFHSHEIVIHHPQDPHGHTLTIEQLYQAFTQRAQAELKVEIDQSLARAQPPAEV